MPSLRPLTTTPREWPKGRLVSTRPCADRARERRTGAAHPDEAGDESPKTPTGRLRTQGRPPRRRRSLMAARRARDRAPHPREADPSPGRAGFAVACGRDAVVLTRGHPPNEPWIGRPLLRERDSGPAQELQWTTTGHRPSSPITAKRPTLKDVPRAHRTGVRRGSFRAWGAAQGSRSPGSSSFLVRALSLIFGGRLVDGQLDLRPGAPNVRGEGSTGGLGPAATRWIIKVRRGPFRPSSPSWEASASR